MLRVWKPDSGPSVAYVDVHFAELAVQRKVNPYVARIRPIDAPLPRIDIQLEHNVPLPDFFWCATIQIVSAKLKHIIESCTDHGVQFFDVHVLDAAQATVQGPYFFMHVIEAIDCFDWEMSKYTMSDGARFILGIDELVLHPVDTSVHKIFRVAHISPFVLCVDESVADAILRAGCSGVAFLNPHEARW